MAEQGEADKWMVALQQAFYEELLERFKFFVDMFFPVNAQGKRLPILMQMITDPRFEWLQLEEIARRSQAVKQGLIEPDSQTQAFDSNQDNAQQRLLELRRQFANEPIPGSVAPGS